MDLNYKDSDTNKKIISIQSGKIKGLYRDGVNIFLGVPYAEPPIGELRFAPTRKKEPWEGVLDCTKYGNIMIQPVTEDNSNPGITMDMMSEDCLYLNVWAPAEVKDAPVYVWIHGGAYICGSGSEPSIIGENFAKKGIIFVSINYRLGVLGFLALETCLEKYKTTGNWEL